MNIFKKGFTDSKGGIMPSVFTSLDSKVSRPLTSRQELENWIRHNKELAGLTDAYRKGLAVSKQLASKTKMMSPALCVAAQLDGKGRQLENVVAEVNSLALDYDDIPEEKMQEVFKRIKLAANTTASWITMSGHAEESSSAMNSKAIATTSMSAPSATSAFAMASIYRKLSTMPTPTSPTNIPTR